MSATEFVGMYLVVTLTTLLVFAECVLRDTKSSSLFIGGFW